MRLLRPLRREVPFEPLIRVAVGAVFRRGRLSSGLQQRREEINALNRVLENPKRPTAAVIGGAKISSKIPVLKNLAAKVDALIVGGGMANTFLLAQGCKIGKSLEEPDLKATALAVTRPAKTSRMPRSHRTRRS